MNNLLQEVIVNPQNKKVLHYLNITATSVITVANSIGTMYAETYGSFIEYTKALPANTKYTANGRGLLIIPKTGLIFGFTHGINSFVFRCNTTYYDIENTDELRILRNIEGIYEDIRELGENWAFLLKFIGDEEEALMASYNASL